MQLEIKAVILSFVDFIIYIFIIMNEEKLDHSFCTKFRADIDRYGLKQVIRDLTMSTSAKVPLRKKYLARECQKKANFRAQFASVCTELKEDRKIRAAVIALQQEISPL